MIMERGKPLSGQCAHPYPIAVTPHEGVKLARCLRCGTVGPQRGGSVEPVRALRGEGPEESKIAS
jgi:hypothetical protein